MPLPRGLRTALPPADDAVVFQALLARRPVPPLESPESRWQVGADPPASVAIDGDTLRLTSPAGHPAWAIPQLPLTPLDGARQGQVEELTWDAAVSLDQRFFVVCELRFAGEPGSVLLQATPFDVQILHDAARPNGGRSESVPRLVGDGRTNFWRLRRDDAGLQLRLNGSPVWSMPRALALAHVAFGEVRRDPLHGGTMQLRNVVYVRRPA